jgi:hypothetical protein
LILLVEKETYSVEEGAFLFHRGTHGKYKKLQRGFLKKSLSGSTSSTCRIQNAVKRDDESFVDRHAGGLKLSDQKIQDVKERLLLA